MNSLSNTSFLPPLSSSMREEHLLKVLEYGKISDVDAFRAMGEALGLQFYHESSPTLYTLSSESFLLDISEDACTIIFVEEELNTKLEYVQRYLNHFLSRRHLFYCLLRFLAKKSEDSPYPGPDCSIHKVFCNCILGRNYCMSFDPVEAADINIFTHSKFCSGRAQENRMMAYVESSSNLAAMLTPEQLFSRHLTEGLYYEEGSIMAQRNSISIDGERSGVASFAFSRGLSLRDSVGVARIFK